jgi:hypothetical protein
MPQASDFVIAWMLITGTGENNTPFDTPQVRAAIQEIAVEHEYMDKREKEYFFPLDKAVHWSDFNNDLRILRERYRDLKDAPKMCESFMYPPKAMLEKGIEFNSQFIKNIKQRIIWEKDREDFYFMVNEEAEFLNKIYYTTLSLQNDYNYVTVKRYAMVELKQLLKKWDEKNVKGYLHPVGEFPPCSPFWRFYEGRK